MPRMAIFENLNGYNLKKKKKKKNEQIEQQMKALCSKFEATEHIC